MSISAALLQVHFSQLANSKDDMYTEGISCLQMITMRKSRVKNADHILNSSTDIAQI